MIAADAVSRTDILESITDAVMVIDGGWRITYANAAAARLNIVDRDALLGRNYWEVFPAFVGKVVYRELLWAAAHRETVKFDHHDESSGMWFHIKAYPTAGGLVIFWEDVNARKGAELEHAELLRREHEARSEAEALNSVSRLAAAELDLQRLMQGVTEAATKLTGAQSGAFLYKVINDDDAKYQIYARSGEPLEDFGTLELQSITSVLKPSFRGAEVLRGDDIRTRPDYAPPDPDSAGPSRPLPIRSYLAVPVISRSGEVLGSLLFGHSEAGVFTERSERMASSIAAHAAIAIDNAHLLARSEAEIRRRQFADELRVNGEQRFRQMIEALPVAIYTTDAEGRLTHFNTASVALAGRVPELGKDRWCLTPKMFSSVGEPLSPDQSPMAAAVLRGQSSRNEEYVAERPDGSRFWFIPYPTALRDDEGRVIGGINMLLDVTERKAGERASLLLGAIVDSSDDAIISKDLNGVITSWNKGAERLFGYTASEAVGKPVTILIPPDRQDEEPNILSRLKRGERVEHFETIRVRKDKSERNISLTISPVKDSSGRVVGASKIARDITDRKLAEAALRETEGRFRQLADSMPQMVWTARPDGSIDYYNQRWYAFTGHREDDPLKEDWGSILHPEDAARCSEQWLASVQSGEPYAVEYRFWDLQEKRWRWFMGRALAVRDKKGSIFKWFGTYTDIDAQKRVEDELRRANEDLEQFAYSASHDLREPLRAVKIYSELLTMRYRDQLDETGREFCDFLRSGATRMEMLVSDLLRYTQLSKLDASFDLIDANAAMSETLANLTGAIQDSGAVITSDDLPSLRMQSIHLKQLLQNLTGNAIKYRSAERTPVVNVAVRQEGEFWLFSIRDNGIGIDPKYKEQIFGLFKRLHAGDQYPGTGIGLAICQRIVERYHGRIWVESEVGRGSTFYFTVPR